MNLREENYVRKGILLVVGTLALLAGCGTQGTRLPGIPVKPKWPGPPYRLALGAPAAKPNPAGIALPEIKFTANPEALERRASLVVRFDTSGVKKAEQQMDQVTVGPFDISGNAGTLPADYIDLADKGLAQLMGAYCMNGKVKISLVLVRSSLAPQAGDDEIKNKSLSDWLPIDAAFKNPHPKC